MTNQRTDRQARQANEQHTKYDMAAEMLAAEFSWAAATVAAAADANKQNFLNIVEYNILINSV